MELNKGIPVKFGKIEGQVFGGKFRAYEPGTRRLVGVKMAEEIDHPHDFKVDTEDFSVPPVQDMVAGLLYGVQSLAKGKDVYAGCMGGVGRTGLYMSCMAKVVHDYHVATGESLPDESLVDPVVYVRKWYNSHAVETRQQKKYVDDFDTKEVVQWLTNHHAPTIVTVDRLVEHIVYLSPLAWVSSFLKRLRTPSRMI